MNQSIRVQANRATITEAARILDIDPATLYSTVGGGVIPHELDEQGRRIVDLEDVEVWKDIRDSGLYASGHDILHLRAMGHDVPSIARLMKIEEDSVHRFFKRRGVKDAS